MLFSEVIAVVLAGGIVAAYFERRVIKAEAVALRTEVVTAGQKFLLALRVKESQVRAKIANDVRGVIAEAKAEAQRVEDAIKTDATRVGAAINVTVCGVEGQVQALVAKIEADLKKVI